MPLTFLAIEYAQGQLRSGQRDHLKQRTAVVAFPIPRTVTLIPSVRSHFQQHSCRNVLPSFVALCRSKTPYRRPKFYEPSQA